MQWFNVQTLGSDMFSSMWDVPGQMLELLLNIFCYQVGTVTGFPSYGGCNNECGEHRSSPELSAQLIAAAQR